MKWYYAKDGERFGPVDFAKLQELIQNAELKPEDLIWNPSLGEEWQEAAKIDGLFSTESSSENLDFTERELNYGEYKDPGQTSNSELMRSARESLAGKWGFAVGITLLYSCIIFIVPSFFGDSAGLINLLLNGPLLLGLTIVFLKIAQNQSAEVKDLFGGFQRFWIPLAAQLLVGLFVFLWSILLLIPGIIATYAYSMTFLIIADNPEIGPYEAIKQSVAMMKGYKLKMFFLSLRFLGWTILACFTFGIGFLWLTPYVYTSLAKFYLDIKTEEAEIVDY